MFISSTSPPAVPAAYLRQFQRDFTVFLESRAAEVVPGGRIVVSMLGRQTEGYTDMKTTLLWDLLSESLAAMVSQVRPKLCAWCRSVVSLSNLLPPSQNTVRLTNNSNLGWRK